MGASKPVNRPNPEQVQQFDACVKHWMRVLGLQRWRIEREPKPAKDAMACVEFNDEAKLATYRLGDFGGTEINHKSLSMTALHEVLHVLLHELLIQAQDKSQEASDLDAAEHAVINVLESVLFGALYGSSKQDEG